MQDRSKPLNTLSLFKHTDLSVMSSVYSRSHLGLPSFDAIRAAGTKNDFSTIQPDYDLYEKELADLLYALKKYDRELQLIDKKIAVLGAQHGEPIGDTQTHTVSLNRLNARKECINTFKNQTTKFWLACHYFATVTQAYQDAYGKTNDYAEVLADIETRYSNPLTVPHSTKPTKLKRIVKDMHDLLATPAHIAKVRDNWIGSLNIYRIHTLFCRLTAKSFLGMLNEFQWLDSFSAALGSDINVAVLDKPKVIYDALSVGLFATRLLINIAMIIKHTFFPSAKERDEKDWYEHALARFIAELEKRYCSMLNDICWGTTNLLSNYAWYFELTDNFANGLTLAFLCFDVGLLVWRRRLDEQKYLAKREQYDQDLVWIDTKNQDGSQEAHEAYKQILTQQRDHLEDDWAAKSATYWFNVAAAAALVPSYAFVLLCSSSVVAPPIGFCLVMVCVAMYLSDQSFLAYQQKRREWLRVLNSDSVVDEYKQLIAAELQDKWVAFWLTLIKNATVPLLITTAFTVSTPFALLALGLYIMYESAQQYFDRPERLAAAAFTVVALAVSWPLALTAGVVYGSYEVIIWACGESADLSLSVAVPS